MIDRIGLLLLNAAYIKDLDSFGILISSTQDLTLICEDSKHPIELEF